MLLQDYGFSFSTNGDKAYRFYGEDLQDRDKVSELLNLVGASLKSPNPVVSASLFAKYYSYTLIAGGLFALTHMGKKLDLSLPMISIETDPLWSPSLVLDRTPTDIEGEACKKQALTSIFLDNLKPVYHTLMRHTGIKKKVLWAHAAYSVHYLFDKWKGQAKEQDEDYQMLCQMIKELEMDFTIIEHPLFSEQKLTLRRECCLRSCLPKATPCTTCPMISDAARMQVLEEYHSKVKV
ncbi:siderophore-iron reductase FhuF [Ammoniphilus sp. CFH 90114]|uniref:siderophore-iron reductase FhuF n=1 Tax=Ammoniphilus sp. CFH 90114 TaxID=2493665 RepID=UPI00100F0989|nr:siderophore-iron reductase FhuF [Ammoniphilus sp. CFH 90114]RXT05240.1 siderophore-iron reductase FhuF [Ammoniphilus sp. CFH 90114]